MSFSEDLRQHAIRLVFAAPHTADSGLQVVELRRAVSAAYYALFHRLSEAAVYQIAPQADPRTASRIHRWLEHGEMKRICEHFTAARLGSPLRELLGGVVSAEMRTVAFSFLKLQEARHSADYDLDFAVTFDQALNYLSTMNIAFNAWANIEISAEGNVFVLSLLLWKNWDKRQ